MSSLLERRPFLSKTVIFADFHAFWWRIKFLSNFWRHGSFCHCCCLQILPAKLIIILVQYSGLEDVCVTVTNVFTCEVKGVRFYEQTRSKATQSSKSATASSARALIASATVEGGASEWEVKVHTLLVTGRGNFIDRHKKQENWPKSPFLIRRTALAKMRLV